MKELFTALLAAREEELVLVSVLKGSGSTPRGRGAQMLVGPRGRIAGTIGGGAVEHRAEKLAMELGREGRSQRRFFPLHPGAGDIGMVCGGDMELWFQYVEAEAWTALAEEALRRIREGQKGWLVQRLDGTGAYLADALPAEENVLSLPLPVGERVVVFGGGHCAQALVPLLKTVGFRVTVMENRAALLDRALFPDAEELVLGEYQNIAAHLTLTEEDYAVVMTSGHTFDFQVQEQLLRRPLAYIGVIGSRSKKAAVNARLREAGIAEEAIARVHTPIGTAIKAVTPTEIAVSIAGEMIYERALRREKIGEVAHGCPMHA